MKFDQKHKNILVGILLVFFGIVLGLSYSAKYGSPLNLASMRSDASGPCEPLYEELINLANGYNMHSGYSYKNWTQYMRDSYREATTRYLDCENGITPGQLE